MMDSSMKIAIPLDDGDRVSPHFGHAPVFAIISIDGSGKIEHENIPNPGHEPGRLPALMRSLGVTHVITGGMGPRAIGLFNEAGIEVVTGVSGSVDSVIEAFLNGTLEGGESMCHHI
ncbi:MAG: NifB/NifX family molybdenum-iron cluster-binding protein [Methanoculleaceae archaeon]